MNSLLILLLFCIVPPGCDFCPLWYPPRCLGLSDEETVRVLQLSTWRCPDCVKKIPSQEICAEASMAPWLQPRGFTMGHSRPHCRSFCYCKQHPVSNLQFAEEATVIETAGVVRQLIIGTRDDMLKWQQTFGMWGEKTKRAVNRGLLKVPLFSGKPESTPF